jgi:hypothetical protein
MSEAGFTFGDMPISADGLIGMLNRDLAQLRLQDPAGSWIIRLHPLDSRKIVSGKAAKGDLQGWVSVLCGCRVVIDCAVVRGDPVLTDARYWVK